jgi:phosphatidylglycerophosphatase A
MVIATFILNMSLIVFVIARVILWFRKFASFRAIEIEKNELIEEIASLNDRVLELADEKNQILALKVSQLGINARTKEPEGAVYANGEPSIASASGNRLTPAFEGGTYGAAASKAARGGFVDAGDTQNGSSTSPTPARATGPSRFVKLIKVDNDYAGKDTHIYMEEEDYVTLPELVTRFCNFAASKLKLYYTPRMISQYFAGMAASKVIILEGISGTGKTSLPYAMGKFFDNNAAMISVQPSWRDRAEILGYLNEFTKRFNETDFLKSLYESTYRKDVNFIVLDEMNLARIEYYFAEFLSIMEMPDPNEWKIDLVPDTKPNDPLKVVNGKITVPLNVWFVGTANKDDSTFTITDKVYDRAIALEFDAKGEFFEAPETDPIHMSSTYLQELFDEAIHKYPVSEDSLQKFSVLDKYIQSKFKVAFGNRIMGQVHKFVPVYVACGGTEEQGLDYIFANKILRKFESLNLAFLQNELQQLIAQIRKIYGKNGFEESVRYIKELSNLM